MERLRVHSSGRFLEAGKDVPFFWLGDTAWELFHKLDREEALEYLDVRAAQGFTVVQAVLLAELDGIRTPNAYGRLPLSSYSGHALEPDTEGEYSYWDHVEYIVGEAEKRGMYMALLPTWGDKWNLMWGIGPELFTPENAAQYGAWVGERFRRFSNILYILGGDRPIVTDRHRSIAEAMARALHAADPQALVSYHPMGPGNSLMNTGDPDWIDFHMLQTGHFSDRDTYRMMEEVYSKTRFSPKPVIDGEPHYESMAVDFCPENGRFIDWDVRQGSYWSVFAGGFGITYGAAGVWRMQRETERSDLYPQTWRESLSLPGAQQMRHIKDLMLSRDFFSRRPCQEILRRPLSWDSRLSACRGKDYLMVYDPNGREICLRDGALTEDFYQVSWFSPRTGRLLKEKLWERSDAAENRVCFQPPERGSRSDWVLLLDALPTGP